MYNDHRLNLTLLGSKGDGYHTLGPVPLLGFEPTRFVPPCAGSDVCDFTLLLPTDSPTLLAIAVCLSQLAPDPDSPPTVVGHPHSAVIKTFHERAVAIGVGPTYVHDLTDIFLGNESSVNLNKINSNGSFNAELVRLLLDMNLLSPEIASRLRCSNEVG